MFDFFLAVAGSMYIERSSPGVENAYGSDVLFLEFLIRFAIEAVALMCSCLTAHSRTAVRDCERIKSVVYMAR